MMTATDETPDRESRKVEVGGLLVDLFRDPRGRPWITYLVIIICGGIWACLKLSQESSFYQRFIEVLIPSSIIIWSGAYWGLLTSAFVHFEFWHVLFNMWWLKDFGALLEPSLGRTRYVLFIVLSAAVSSGAELAVMSETGIGFSGVVYAMFGYLLAARHTEPAYQRILTKGTIVWLLGWLVLCVVLTYAGIWRVANAAHIAGFLFGYCATNAFAARVRAALNKTALSALVALTVLSVAYMPWSETWKHRKAYAEIIAMGDAAEAGNVEAQHKYAGILSRYGKKADEMAWLKKAADQEYVPAMNDLAWNLATNRDDASRDGKEAVKLAERACRKDNWKDPQYIDTLAAAYAEAEQWDDAVKTQRLAISKSGADGVKGKASLESRLQQYLRREKARE
jgi:membrane associated rhomboid family serine protease